jgi:hypothetical protein
MLNRPCSRCYALVAVRISPGVVGYSCSCSRSPASGGVCPSHPQTMTYLVTSLIVFMCVFATALFGIYVSPKLPIGHLTPESKDVVRLAMGLVSTTVAVALGLLISSAKSFYDTQSNEVTQLAANYIMLDQVLASYGPEARDVRSGLRDGLANLLGDGYLQGSDKHSKAYGEIKSGARLREDVFAQIQGLSPKDDNQRSLKAQALSLVFQLGQTRWLIFEQNEVPVPNLLIYMLGAWLIVLFLSFGIFAPRNLTVFAGLFIAALAVCGAILLILEMYHPQGGLIRVSDAPLRAALTQIAQ